MKNKQWNLENSYITLPQMFYTFQYPSSVKNHKLVIFNEELAEVLGIPNQSEVFCGNVIPDGSKPIAQAYAGHQFGYFTMLGDGRAVLLGEQRSVSGERFDIQLKGSGRTPYSRGGDGKAALGPMLREYIISEAMYALGIPTTRSLAVVTTGESVLREKELTGAVLTRVAASHIRVGTFEYAARFGTIDDVRSLADYTIKRHFPSISDLDEKYLLFLQEVIKRQAILISKWQLVGFIHGVMNTDNMAISGETIDYGPCAFMDVYNLATVFSSIDNYGRYSYENQPKMAMWNLARFAETLLPLLHEDENKAIELAQEQIEGFWDLYQEHWLSGMCSKLGINQVDKTAQGLIIDLLQLLQNQKADFTQTFQDLTLGKYQRQIYIEPDFKDWHYRWQKHLKQQSMSSEDSKKLMKSHNPAIIPRNYRVEEALSAAETGDLSKLHQLLDALKNPYAYTTEQEALSEPLPTSSCRYQTFCGT